VGDFTAWQGAARWLAGLHGRFAAAAKGLGESAPLLHYDSGFFRLWLEGARTAAFAATPHGSDARRRVERLALHYDRVVEQLSALPITLLHGEFYASNVLVLQGGEGLRVCPVDWEMAGLGPGLLDLAALIAGKWSEAKKVSLALAYYAALPSDSAWPNAPEAFLAALDWCRLYVAVQWLGWRPGWSPPPDHANDWLGELLNLTKKLGL
jgi:thiamine kinase-like enzyme